MRPHSFARTQIYELEGDGLHVREDGKAEKRVPFAAITSVSLISYANFGGSQKQCAIGTQGHGTLKVRSHHYVSLGQFEDRSTGYTSFVRELCRRVHAANPAAQFTRGSGSLRIVWSIVLVLALFGWIGMIAAVRESAASMWNFASGFVVLALCTLLGLRAFTGNKVQHFDPSNPPQN